MRISRNRTSWMLFAAARKLQEFFEAFEDDGSMSPLLATWCEHVASTKTTRSSGCYFGGLAARLMVSVSFQSKAGKLMTDTWC